MNLNSYHKQAFVSAVMQDVPVPDFNSQYEKLIKADMLKTAPDFLKKALADKNLFPYLITGDNSMSPESFHYKNCYYRAYEVGIHSVATHKHYRRSDEAKAEELNILEQAVEAHISRNALKERVQSTINGCRTLKQALTLLPEFAKYLPEEVERGSMLPAVANLTADLIKAGWPVGKEEAVAA